MANYENILVVIPSLDPDERLLNVIRGVQAKGFTDILLVDDGSAPENQHYFEEGAALGCTVLHHEVNKGKGRALKTAFEWFMKNRPDSAAAVTIDGDDQHKPDDIAACVDLLDKQTQNVLILGCRNFDLDHVPPKSRFGNKLTSSVFRLFCGLKVSDTQTGLRVFPRGIIPKMLEVSGERFEYETNMLLVCKQADIPLVEQTIETVYINSNETTHFHPVKDSLRIYGIIIKFFLSSLLSFLLDYGLFNVFYALFRSMAHRLFMATALARILSSIFNFTVNRKAVFRSDAPLSKTIARYYILWGFQLLASFGLVRLLSGIFGEGGFVVAILKLIVDMFLYFISFRVQQAWVFKPDNTQPVGEKS